MYIETPVTAEIYLRCYSKTHAAITKQKASHILLHIIPLYKKPPFLPCKSMVFGVQKGGFYIAKVWFLFFECCVVAICLECYHNPFATFWQTVRNVLANR